MKPFRVQSKRLTEIYSSAVGADSQIYKLAGALNNCESGKTRIKNR